MLTHGIIVERFCQIVAVMASPEYGDTAWLLLYFDECYMFGDIHTRPYWTGKLTYRSMSDNEGLLKQPSLGTLLGVL
jgi:hypothetical protein